MSVFFTLPLGQPGRGRTKRPLDDSVTLHMSLTLLKPLFAHLSSEDRNRFLLELLRTRRAHTGTSPGVVFSDSLCLLGLTLGSSVGRKPWEDALQMREKQMGFI